MKKKASTPIPVSQEHVAHIIACVGRATEAERLAGLAWYDTFSQAVTQEGARWGLERETSLALFALLSQQAPIARNWANFQAIARDRDCRNAVCVTRAQRAKIAGLLGGSLGPVQAAKGDKISNFYRNLAGEHECVTIDRHAMAVAEGWSMPCKNLTSARYRACEAAYQVAAASLNITPAQCQAIAWVVWRRHKGNQDQGGLRLVA